MSAENLALVFVPNVIRASDSSSEFDLVPPKDMKPLVVSFKLLIQNVDVIFDQELPEDVSDGKYESDQSDLIEDLDASVSPSVQSNSTLGILVSEVIDCYFDGEIDTFANVLNCVEENPLVRNVNNSIVQANNSKIQNIQSRWVINEQVDIPDNNSKRNVEKLKDFEKEQVKSTVKSKPKDQFVEISYLDYLKFRNIPEIESQIFALKATIHDFESNFYQMFKKRPHGKDRDPIRPELENYFDLQKKLKNIAAIKIQSVVRMFLCRFRYAPSFTRSLFLSPLEVANYRLEAMRVQDKRPREIELMNAEEKKAEKAAVKRELRLFDLKFAKKFNREPQRSDKEVMRPLYQLYKSIGKDIDTVDLGARTDNQIEPQPTFKKDSKYFKRAAGSHRYHPTPFYLVTCLY
ncbi:hypothetical protein GEMRC1_011215 [Eukaryota sp. GEM-RC1]